MYESLKRALDVGVSAAGLVALSGPMLAVAVAIKLESEGPVFYRGERVGKDGRSFRIFKFRSMRESRGGPDSTSLNDDRITRIGKVLRRLKLDELPQLLNVLRGEMSLVGPRPEVRWCVDLYTEEEKQLLTLRPGITDWASLKFHNEGEIIAKSGYKDPDRAYLALIRPEKLRLQLKYLRERSLSVDARIIAETVVTIVRTRASGEESV